MLTFGFHTPPPAGIICILLPKLKPVEFSYGDVVNGPLINARELCFVLSGAVRTRVPESGPDVEHTEGLPRGEDQFETGDRFGEATLVIPEDIPFRLRLEYYTASRICNALVLTRLDFSQIKLVYKQIFSEIEQELVGNVADLYHVVDVDQDRMESEFLADMAAETAHRLLNPSASKQSSTTKPKRKKRGRGRGR